MSNREKALQLLERMQKNSGDTMHTKRDLRQVREYEASKAQLVRMIKQAVSKREPVNA